MDDELFRAFDTMENYRRWCESHLPDWPRSAELATLIVLARADLWREMRSNLVA